MITANKTVVIAGVLMIVPLVLLILLLDVKIAGIMTVTAQYAKIRLLVKFVEKETY